LPLSRRCAPMHETIRRFAVDTLARVEGEGSMYLTIDNGEITNAA